MNNSKIINLELLRDNNILWDILLRVFKKNCLRLDNNKYTHNQIAIYKEMQELLILKGKIKAEECELK